MLDLQIIFNILISWSIYLLTATSFIIIYYTARFFHFAHGAIIASGAYLNYFLFRQIGWPLWLSVVVSVFLSTLIGVACELTVYRPLRKRGGKEFALLIVSLGIYIVLQNIISIVWGDGTVRIQPEAIAAGRQICGAYITNVQILIISCSFLLFLLCGIFLKSTMLGKSMRAVSCNAELCDIFGINSNRIVSWSFIIGSAFAAIVGILVSFNIDAAPTIGFNLLLYGVVATIIGGVGSLKGPALGALLLASVQHLSAYYGDSRWMDVTTFLILIVFLCWKPLGFSGKILRKVEI